MHFGHKSRALTLLFQNKISPLAFPYHASPIPMSMQNFKKTGQKVQKLENGNEAQTDRQTDGHMPDGQTDTQSSEGITYYPPLFVWPGRKMMRSSLVSKVLLNTVLHRREERNYDLQDYHPRANQDVIAAHQSKEYLFLLLHQAHCFCIYMCIYLSGGRNKASSLQQQIHFNFIHHWGLSPMLYKRVDCNSKCFRLGIFMAVNFYL